MGDAAIFSYEYSGELTYDCNQWKSSTAMHAMEIQSRTKLC